MGNDQPRPRQLTLSSPLQFNNAHGAHTYDVEERYARLARGIGPRRGDGRLRRRAQRPSGPQNIAGPNVSQSNDQGDDEDDGDDDKTIYDQTDFLGNPLVSEVTIVKANHARYNKTQPYNTATFLPQTAAFVTGFGRPLALATAARQRAVSGRARRRRVEESEYRGLAVVGARRTGGAVASSPTTSSTSA